MKHIYGGFENVTQSVANPWTRGGGGILLTIGWGFYGTYLFFFSGETAPLDSFVRPPVHFIFPIEAHSNP